jgi:hypothetical protein
MTPHIPWYLATIVIAAALAIAGVVWLVLSRAAARSGVPAAARRSIQIGSALFLAAWLGAILLLAPDLAWLREQDPFYLNPLIPFFGTVPLALMALALWRSPALRRAVVGIPLATLVGVHAWRVVGAVFVILYAMGRLPGHFALPAGWGDVAVGLTAPALALALARGVPGGRAVAIAWTALGLLDLVVAVGMGTGFLAPLLAPGLGSRVPPAAAMAAFPMILVPTFAVPMSVGFHLLALVRLVRPATQARQVAPSGLGAG